ncbi:MAG: hypothetical protein L6R41_002142 [Letrouitia leprolyta]|nr:MAG: hypothetical protein L6R41_002142 [Letrouitia leprolyta]
MSFKNAIGTVQDIAWLDGQLKKIPASTLSVVVGHGSIPPTQWSSPLAEAFSRVARYAQTINYPSIDGIVDRLVQERVLDITTQEEGPLEARNFVFAVLGWQTMLYRPALGTCPPQQLAVADERGGYRGQAFMTLKQSHLSTKRPFHEFLMGFGILLPPANCCISTNVKERKAFDELEAIGSDMLNASLLDSIGHIKLKWVDIMSCHLEFDKRTNTVFLFRFPSFCAVHYLAGLSEKETNVIHAAAAPVSSSRQRAVEEDIDQMLKEILTSYRLLFGQNKRARKLFKLRDATVGRSRNVKDRMLFSLCGVKSFKLGKESLDKDFYDLKQDFPILRSRISRLHRILSAKNPRNWRDKRDSAGWYTFWTVLIFGAVFIRLSFF